MRSWSAGVLAGHLPRPAEDSDNPKAGDGRNGFHAKAQRDVGSDRTHLMGEWLIIATCFFFAALRLCVTSHRRFLDHGSKRIPMGHPRSAARSRAAQPARTPAL